MKKFAYFISTALISLNLLAFQADADFYEYFYFLSQSESINITYDAKSAELTIVDNDPNSDGSVEYNTLYQFCKNYEKINNRDLSVKDARKILNNTISEIVLSAKHLKILLLLTGNSDFKKFEQLMAKYPKGFKYSGANIRRLVHYKVYIDVAHATLMNKPYSAELSELRKNSMETISGLQYLYYQGKNDEKNAILMLKKHLYAPKGGKSTLQKLIEFSKERSKEDGFLFLEQVIEKLEEANTFSQSYFR